MTDLQQYFKSPLSSRQKQYETIRAIVIDQLPINTAAKRFGYKFSTVQSLLRDVKSGNINLFPEIQKGPIGRRISSDVNDLIIAFRKQRLSAEDIEGRLVERGINISERTIQRILMDAGFSKLRRRTYIESGKSLKNKMIPKKSAHLDFSELKPFNIDCPSVGIFFFIPYILESGILDVVQKCQLPKSSQIESLQASLSMLLLKLIGCKRLSHIGTYDQEAGLGVFAGLNVLPKPTYMNTYSCRCSEKQLMDMQNKIIKRFKKQYSDFYNDRYINLDFHTIPHYGDESQMQKLWCGAKHQNMKGANTVFAQDSQSNAIIYTRADILRNEESDEIKKFVSYWKTVSADVKETLVFDCKFTKYAVLDELEDDNIKFITLQKRYNKLLKEAEGIPKKNWKKVYLPIPKRKYKHVSVYQREVKLTGCQNTFRQIIVKDHGRSTPTFVLTNDRKLKIEKALEVYAKRWHVENKLAELITFFNLNALSSPIMTRIHFDIFWTMIADTLYHIFAQDLRRFEHHLAPSIFKKFIDMPGRVIYDGNKFLIKIRKRAHTPILMEVEKLSQPFTIPWLDNKTLEIVWSA